MWLLDKVLGKYSVIGVTFKIALLGAVLAMAFKYAELNELFGFEQYVLEWKISATVLSGFQGTLGFMLVFRTSQAYSRYMAACTLIQQMEGSFFESCSNLMAFVKVSKEEDDKVLNFRRTLVCLFSLMSAYALRTLMVMADEQGYGDEDTKLDVLYADSLSPKTLEMMRKAKTKSRVLLLNHWLQSFIAQSQCNGLLNIPPPILTRAYAQLANGIVKFEDALKLVLFPFPGTYSRTTLGLLGLDFLMTPFALCDHVERPWIGGLFTFSFLFTFWGLFLTAEQLECPFGTDSLDLDMIGWQRRMNDRLEMLVTDYAYHLPELLDKGDPENMTLALVLDDAGSDSDSSTGISRERTREDRRSLIATCSGV